jgi:hypothetical protein
MLDRYVHGASGGDDPAIAYPGSNADHTAAEYLYADRLGSIVASFNRSGGLKTINAYDGSEAERRRSRRTVRDARLC